MEANLPHSAISFWQDKPYKKPEAYKSPAPVVSIEEEEDDQYEDDDIELV